MVASSRFECASSLLRLSSLIGRTRRRLWVCVALGMAAHLSLLGVRRVEAERKAAKPLTTQFVKRQPRLTKPLELKKLPRPKRRQIQRTMVSVKARARPDRSVSRLQPAQILGRVATPTSRITRMAEAGAVHVEREAMAGLIESTREIEQKIDMSLELLDLEALDTGQYHALVVQDPDDKQSIKGFCHLAIAKLPPEAFDHPYSFEWYVLPGFQRLARTVNEYTGIKTDAAGRITLNDGELFKVPWLFLSAHLRFELGAAELENLGKYMISGGFAFADAHDADNIPAWKGGLRSLISTLKDALVTQGIEPALEKLPNSHCIYHCYFDFDGPPIGGDAAQNSIHPVGAWVIPYLEGIHVNGRLVAILSRKNYAHAWALWGPDNYVGYGAWLTWDPTRPMRFGINTIIFALTQEGSITHRLMDSIR